MYESRAIARYINDTRGNKLVPADAKSRALGEQWISLEQGSITPTVSPIVSQRIFVPMFGGKCDDAKVAEHAEKAKQGLDILDKHLSTHQYLAGSTFSLGRSAPLLAERELGVEGCHAAICTVLTRHVPVLSCVLCCLS